MQYGPGKGLTAATAKPFPVPSAQHQHQAVALAISSATPSQHCVDLATRRSRRARRYRGIMRSAYQAHCG